MAVSTEQRSLDQFQRIRKIGEGTYGIVYEAKDLRTGKTVALKKIKIDDHEEGIPATTLREVSLLKCLKHPSIIELYQSLYVDGQLYLVFRYMTNDLKKYLDSLKSKNMGIVELKRLSYRLIEGVRMCHANRILHRDLKPQNLLIDANGTTLKLADFGLGREHGLPIGKLTHEVVTLWYRPPEILLGQEMYSGACDVWAIGCIIVEMGTKQAFFPGDSEIDQLYKHFQVLGTPTEEQWKSVSTLPDYKAGFPNWQRRDLAKVIKHEHTGRRQRSGEGASTPEKQTNIDDAGIALVARMLEFAPFRRVTAKEALRDPWFDDIRDEMDDILQSEMNALIRMHSGSDCSLRLNEAASIVGSRAGFDLSFAQHKHLTRLAETDRVITHDTIHDYWRSVAGGSSSSGGGVGSAATVTSVAAAAAMAEEDSTSSMSWRAAGSKRRRVAMDVE